MNKIFTKIKYIYLYIFAVIFLIFTAVTYTQHVYTSNFVDEEDNFTVGKYLVKGESLYTDIFSHHQPVPYLISAGIQSIKDPDNVEQLVKWHRYFMIAWSALWCILLIIVFGVYALPFVIVYELVKIHYIGHTFLAEALVVYPITYIFLTFVLKKRLNTPDIVFIGLLASFVMFTLAPAWPLIVFLSLLVLLKLDKKMIKYKISAFLAGFILFTAGIFYNLDILDYYFDAIYVNLNYYINPVSGNISLVYSLFTPVINLFSQETNLFLKVLSFLFILKLFVSIKMGNVKETILIVIILGLANIRYVQGGFHMLPWLGLFIGAYSYLSIKILNANNRLLFWKKWTVVSLSVLLLFIFFQGRDNLFRNIDQEKEKYIHYSQQYDYGKAVSILADKNDRFMVLPVEPLILWQADIAHATEYTYYYEWMSRVPHIKKSVESAFTNNPPEFLYFDANYGGGNSGISKYLQKYRNIKRNNKDSKLFILKSKIEEIDTNQKKDVSLFDFTI